MNTLTGNRKFNPRASGALRYERLAKLEAVLVVRNKNRNAFRRRLVIGFCMAAAAAVWYFAL